MKVSSAGFEPTAYRLGICRSIHLSYEDKLDYLKGYQICKL